MPQSYTDHTVGWLSALIGALARIRAHVTGASRGFVATPWGRAQGGWSA